ncbi:hypothetical protein ACFVS2_21020 [Brevibacillus sp. NPDC058079]|uniref:hypothetical protein n=1 Tax=Brevibacillus sp. NPDC058079 TaxID=3346330 RepID=UPI0036F17F1F
MKTQVSFCSCGSPMSTFEVEHYRKCTSCHTNEQEFVRKEAAEKKELEEADKERMKKEEKERKERKEREQQNRITSMLQQLEGKTIERVTPIKWTTILDSIEAEAVEILCTDGSTATFSMEELADGCRGCYDYYHYLEAEVYLVDSESGESQ